MVEEIKNKKSDKSSWAIGKSKKINLSLKVIKQKDQLSLTRQLASGKLPNGTTFKVLDTGGFYLVQHKYDKKNPNTWYTYQISKEEIMAELVNNILIDSEDN